MKERRMTFLEHLGELRTRLIRSAIFYAAGVIVSFYIRDYLFSALRFPLPDGTKLYYFGVTEAFFFYLKISLIFGLILSFPFIAYEIYGFFAPALTKKEKRLIFPVIPIILVLFILGVLFTYFIVMPYAVKFLLSFGGEELESLLQVDKYFGFVIGLALAGGIAFELPVVLFILAKLGWVTAKGLIRNFRYAFLIILLISAILTPTPDAFTMLVLAMPLVILYLASILVVSQVKPLEAEE